ncbi:MAG: hypothetical protein KAT37_03050 [Candidatus Aenigmarchaeota archaeon]|nr:hypothetical protein [Candidatus Aenigmarchaeota archaeon]
MKEIIHLLSLTNLSLGFLSVFLSVQGHFLYAAFFMVSAAIIDIAHLSTSKLMKSDSVFGKDLNNISGMVSFAVAPAVFSYLVLFEQLAYPLTYLFLAMPLALILSGVIRTARLNSGEITSWHGMKITFNTLIPVLYIFNIFSIFLVSGWMMLSTVFMLSKFNLRSPSRKKKLGKNVELKDDYEFNNARSKYTVDTVDEDEEKQRKKFRRRKKVKEEEETPLVPLSIFGD